jgi:hypothetical protein
LKQISTFPDPLVEYVFVVVKSSLQGKKPLVVISIDNTTFADETGALVAKSKTVITPLVSSGVQEEINSGKNIAANKIFRIVLIGYI